MSAVADNKRSCVNLLHFALGCKKMSLILYHLEDAVVIAHDTCQINRNNRFGSLVYSGFHFVVIHFKTALLTVNKHGLCADMTDDRSGCGVGIGRHNYLVALADTQNTQGHLRAGGLGRKANSLIGVAKIRNVIFEYLGFGSCCNPTRFQNGNNGVDFRLGNIGR